jgi:hypothetical protein
VQWQALGATSAGLGFFAALYSFASWVDKPSKVPFVSLPATLCAVCLTADQHLSMHPTRQLRCAVCLPRKLSVSVGHEWV